MKVLFILTSADKIGKENKPTGFWYEELTIPYYELIDKGFQVDFASPNGGKPPYDPNSLAADIYPVSVERFLKDVKVQQQFQHSHKISRVNFDRYQAVFFPGGHGAVVDLPKDKDLAEKLGAFFEKGKIVAAVCHGPGALISARKSDGKSILYERKVSCFTNTEEEKTHLKDDVPFLLEDKVVDCGARFERGEDFEEFAVRDRNLITGQNPASSRKVAELLVGALRK